MYPITGTTSYCEPAWTHLIHGSACMVHQRGALQCIHFRIWDRTWVREASHLSLLQALFVVTPFSPVEWEQLHASMRQLGITDAEQQRMQPDLRLRVGFPLAPAHAQQSPAIRLHIPAKLESLAGGRQ